MYFVNWNEAVEFCEKLNNICVKDIPVGYQFDLPTEAQWERACRAGTDTALYNGPIEIKGENNAPALDEIAWYGGNSSVDYKGAGWKTEDWKEMQYPGGRAGPHKVKGKKANAYGLYDMLGNVYEWCRDWYGSYPEGAVTNPTGLATGSRRVNRGGSWYNGARYCRSSNRSSNGPSGRNFILGFRVALVPVP